jgi:ferredoxin/flavodoxin---NADP+ reductase
VVGDGEADLDAFDPTGGSASLAESDRHVRGNYKVISDWAARPASGQARRLTLRFWLRPVEIQGSQHVDGLVLERTRLDDSGAFVGTGELETLPVGMVLRSVGYQSVPLPGVPFDEKAAVVPNAEGRVTGPDGKPLPGEYVAGWLKRGPTGVIGTNKSDAAQTVRALLEDLAGGPGPDGTALPRAGLLRYPQSGSDGQPDGASPLAALLAERGVRAVGYQDWLRIEAAEAALGESLGRGGRVKLPGSAALQAACWPDLPAED